MSEFQSRKWTWVCCVPALLIKICRRNQHDSTQLAGNSTKLNSVGLTRNSIKVMLHRIYLIIQHLHEEPA
jgi:hypothetical protein